MSNRYVVKDYYIWDTIDKCQVILFDRVSEMQAEKVCELLNEHEAMKLFFLSVADAIRGDDGD